jgi:hypothetical protein
VPQILQRHKRIAIGRDDSDGEECDCEEIELHLSTSGAGDCLADLHFVKRPLIDGHSVA